MWYDWIFLRGLNSMRSADSSARAPRSRRARRSPFQSDRARRSAAFPAFRLPFSLKILLENLLRQETAASSSKPTSKPSRSGRHQQAAANLVHAPRVLLQDSPASRGRRSRRHARRHRPPRRRPDRVNPLQPVELVIDQLGAGRLLRQQNAFELNAGLEFSRNKNATRSALGTETPSATSVCPAGHRIVHQVNLEYLARVVMTAIAEGTLAFPDTLVGTDSHTRW